MLFSSSSLMPSVSEIIERSSSSTYSSSSYFRPQTSINSANEEAAKEASKVSTGTALAGAGAAVGAISVGVAVLQNLRKPNTPNNNNDSDDSRNTDDDDDNNRRNQSDNNNGDNEDSRKTSDESRNNCSDEDVQNRREENDEGRVTVKIKKPLESTKLELSPEDFKQITEMLRQNKKTFKIL
jgi:hypothetical protein